MDGIRGSDRLDTALFANSESSGFVSYLDVVVSGKVSVGNCLADGVSTRSCGKEDVQVVRLPFVVSR